MGGGIYILESSAKLKSLIIKNCFAEDGGGLAVMGSSSVQAEQCRLDANTAIFYGGGVFTQGTPDTVMLSLTDCEFVANRGEHAAGGAWLSYSNSLVEGCIFFENWAADECGGLRSVAGSLFVNNCTFAENSGAGFGDGLLVDRNAVVSNSIFAFNRGGAAIYCVDSIYLECSNVYGNEGGDWVGCLEGMQGQSGNFSSDPLFCDLSLGDLTLLETSPCLPQNNVCAELIGALPAGCPIVGVDDETISQLNIVLSVSPNPFNAMTQFHVTMFAPDHVTVKVFDVLGRTVDELFSGYLGVGSHTLCWPASSSSAASGIYVVSVTTRNFKQTRKVVMIK